MGLLNIEVSSKGRIPVSDTVHESSTLSTSTISVAFDEAVLIATVNGAARIAAVIIE